ncbi:protein unc-93 homolog A [Nilaparvata lugens]|uniref:protein unc-93 homolog A n=1 Tax=Nilaparvata lugens TaxID=108931 RepID=UPI00193E1D0A|nr:protein unc-93 homolog A [Nilaparvata lugens]
MGSLPDLHALTRDDTGQPCCRPGSHLPRCSHLPVKRLASASPGSDREASISSVKKLIAVVRSTPSSMGPSYSRQLLCRNLAALCLGHAISTAAFSPLLALHGSSASYLLAMLFSVAALSSAASPFILRNQSVERRMIIAYFCQCLFFAAHFYPTMYLLIPAYFLMGLTLGPLSAARVSLLMTLASKLYADEDDHVAGQRVALVQRLLRSLRAAHDVGLIAGNAFASFVLYKNAGLIPKPTVPPDLSGCGSAACPDTSMPSLHEFNQLPCGIDYILIGVCLGCCVTAAVLTGVTINRIEPTVTAADKQLDAFKRLRQAFVDPRLRLAAPMSLFVGLEQGFMYSDFTESYVLCSLSMDNVGMVFFSLAILQAIAGFTLSMLLQHVKRYMVIGMGFAFHACLLMVLVIWKPAGDDPALIYVIAAAWGVCNAVWDTLSFGLMMSSYHDSWQGPVAHSYIFRYSGLALAFVFHGLLCNETKLYCLAVALVLCVAPYTWLEMKEVRHRNQR